MQTQIMIAVANLEEASIVLNAIAAFREKDVPAKNKGQEALSPLAERIYDALNTSTFTKPSQVATKVLLATPPSETVPLARLIEAFIAEGLAGNHDEAWNRVRAAFANLSWLMGQRLLPEDLSGVSKPVDVFAPRSLDQNGKRLYRLSDAGRAAAEKFFQ
ncbi:MAG TPA: hypothetical protein VFA12_02985 [Stellaceae bacterium]|nr:hypothetical protein [Stellaceae bacterium]